MIDVNACVESYKDDIIGLASALVKIPSENRAPDGDEKAAQQFLAEWFRSNDIDVDVFNIADVQGIKNHEAYWPGRNYSDRPNVVACIKGKGNGKSLMFSSHMDTVTRNPIPWEISQPFSGEVIGDKLYGRGSYDMKASLAATAVILKIIREAGIELSGDVYVESVVDEENAGANGTLASRLKGYNPDFAIIPEPSNMNICPQSKGGQVFEILFRGSPGVRYAGETVVNPIYGLAKIVQCIEKYEKSINSKDNLPIYYKYDMTPRNVVISKVKAGDLTPGGNVGNPDSAWLEMFVQVLPGFDEKDLWREIKHFLKKIIESDPVFSQFRPEIKPSSRFLYPSVTDSTHPFFNVLKTSYQNIIGTIPQLVGAPFACDSFIFNKYFKVPTALFGPSGGNAHGKDEWVSIESLINFVKISLGAVLQYCG